MSKIVLDASDRRSLRRAVGAQCQVVTEREFSLLGERTIDLSEDGLLVESDADVAVGECVIVSLRAPGTRVWVDAQAEVARVARGRRSGERRGIAIRFRHMDGPYRALLSAALRGHPPPIPARARRRDYARSVREISGG